MNIHGPAHIHGPHGVNAPHIVHRGPNTQAAPAGGSVDRVDISPAAEAAIEAAETGGVRLDVVNRIRAQIASGTYDTPDKLDVAVERLLDEIG